MMLPNMEFSYCWLYLCILLAGTGVSSQHATQNEADADQERPAPDLDNQAADFGMLLEEVRSQRVHMNAFISRQAALLSTIQDEQRALLSKIDDLKSSVEQKRDNVDLQEFVDNMKQTLEKQHRDILANVMSNPCSGNVTGLTEVFSLDPVTVPCDGNNWIVILRRVDNDYDFPGRKWNDYEDSFGDLKRSFWLGLNSINRLTTLTDSVMLRVELEDFNGETRFAQYSYFRVDGKSDGYRLHVGGYTGDAGDSMARQNGMKFTTSDRDNDDDGSEKLCC